MRQRGWITCLLFLLAACEQVNYRSSIPYAPVNYTLYITSEYPHFVIDNGFQVMTITEKKLQNEHIGYSGLLIWIGMDNAYHAADLCCPHCVKRTTPLTIDGLYATCETCGEVFDISFGLGIPTKGITREPLKKYTALYRNMTTSAQLQIRN